MKIRSSDFDALCYFHAHISALLILYIILNICLLCLFFIDLLLVKFCDIKPFKEFVTLPIDKFCYDSTGIYFLCFITV